MSFHHRKWHRAHAGAGDVEERILDAALAVLREQGITRFTQTEVATRAGVRQSHLTYYFPTRHDLIEAATTRVVDGMGAHLAATTGAGDRARLTMLEHLAEAISDHEHMRMFIAVVVEADHDPAVRAIVVRATDRLTAHLAGVLGGAHLIDQARLVMTALWGLGFYRFVVRPSRDRDPVKQCLPLLVESLGSRRRGGVQ